MDGRLPSGVFVSLCRHSRDFNERDRLVLNLLRPHLFQAYRNSKAMTRVRRELERTSNALEAVEQAVIVLDRRGRVAILTARARKRVDDYFGTPLCPGRRLAGTLQEWVKRQLDLFNRIGGYPPPLAPLVLEREEKRLTVRLINGEENTILLLEEQLSGITPESLHALGLSRREAEVLALCAAGKTNIETGMLLDVRAKTVAKHLERIFDKLGVETRTRRRGALSIVLRT